MADCTSLTGNAAACNTADNVELLFVLCANERLTNDELQCVEAKVIVDVTIVDCDLTCTLVQSYTSNRVLSAACAIEERSFIVHNSVTSYYSSQAIGCCAACLCSPRRRTAA